MGLGILLTQLQQYHPNHSIAQIQLYSIHGFPMQGRWTLPVDRTHNFQLYCREHRTLNIVSMLQGCALKISLLLALRPIVVVEFQVAIGW